MSQTLEALRQLIREKFDIDAGKIEADASVLESGLDSLALTELLFEVEERFGVELLEGARTVTTLGDLSRLIDDLRSTRLSAATSVGAPRLS